MARQRASVPHVRFYASDWLAGTAQLSAVERGVYITLLAMFWDSDGRLENNTRRLATACGMRIDHFEKALQGLVELGKIDVRGGYIFNHRAEMELHEAREARLIEHKKLSDKGHLSATKRGELRAQNINENNDSVQPNQEPRTKNQEEDIRSPTDSGGKPPVATVEADLFRRARALLGESGAGLVARARRAGMADEALLSIFARHERGEVGDLRTYLGSLGRSRAPPRKTPLMAALDELEARVRDDQRGSGEDGSADYLSLPEPRTARP